MYYDRIARKASQDWENYREEQRELYYERLEAMEAEKAKEEEK